MSVNIVYTIKCVSQQNMFPVSLQLTNLRPIILRKDSKVVTGKNEVPSLDREAGAEGLRLPPII